MSQPADATAASPTVTRLERRWVLRMVLIAVFFAGFSLWGLYDATVAYPARGREVADSYLLEVLKLKYDQPAYLTAEVGTADPRAELARLSEKADAHSASDFDTAKFRWLDALRLVRALDTEHTTIVNPAAKRQELTAAAAARPPGQSAKPLSPWDIPAQWLIFLSCAVIAVWMFTLVLITRARTYTWDAAALRLGLPGGHSLTPADIRDFDKRKWHKFIVFLGIKPEHPTLGGRSVKLDLYCHTDLEAWVLEMEKVVNPSAAETPTPPSPTPPSPTPAA